MINSVVENVEIFPGLFIQIPEGSPKPKSALGFVNFLATSEDNFMFNKKILELGCGHHASLAHSALYRKAAYVEASEICPTSVEVVSSFGDKRINFIQSDLFCKTNKPYDVILFNPPQMPMESRTQTDNHDSPGPTGLEIIERTLRDCSKFFGENGSLYMMLFDFLSTSDALASMANRFNLNFELVHTYRRNIRSGGATEANLDWIHKQYPSYTFQIDDSGDMFMKCDIIKFTND